MADIAVGKISHYFDKINVAVLDVEEESVNVGDTIKIAGSGGEFEQTVESMQVEHESVQTAEKGMAVGLKVAQKVKRGDKVYKVV
ncbi:MAG: hypothetical protein ABH867_00415 [Patescibacteria group bacterium]|nr:hypothetical protein [Patescibacteria group bacterium]